MRVVHRCVRNDICNCHNPNNNTTSMTVHVHTDPTHHHPIHHTNSMKASIILRLTLSLTTTKYNFMKNNKQGYNNNIYNKDNIYNNNNNNNNNQINSLNPTSYGILESRYLTRGGPPKISRKELSLTPCCYIAFVCLYI